MRISVLSCGASEIRTRDTLLTYTRFPGVPLQPLEHRSFALASAKLRIIFELQIIRPTIFTYFFKPYANWLSGRKYHTLFRSDEKVVNNPTDNGSDENNYEYP